MTPDGPVDPASPQWREVLELMQGNILKGHGRRYSALLLIQFGQASTLRAQLAKLATKWVTSANEQQRQSQQSKEESQQAKQERQQPGDRARRFANLFLSVWGYRSLGYNESALSRAFPHHLGDLAAESEPSSTNWFLHGMEYHGSELRDLPKVWWEPEYQQRVDAMLLLACNDERERDRAEQEAANDISAFGTILKTERGRTHLQGKMTLEPFGYVDGISQPRFFIGNSDLESPSIVLENDLLAEDPRAMGSYLVYRKLEQNVAGFLAEENRLADSLGLTGADRERAGAMVVGRFRDGSPLTKSAVPGWTGDQNDFDFADDKSGLKCPFHAHIRKVRPRTLNGEKVTRNRMVRRGVPYGPYDPTKGMTPPETGSGLLFLSLQRSIESQFGVAQRDWVNGDNFPETNTGQDPTSGQGWSLVDHRWPVQWAKEDTRGFRFGRFVTLKGGEFFFAPSREFFRKLA